MEQARIYVGQSRQYPVLENALFCPLYVGREKNPVLSSSMQNAYVGESIADSHAHWGDLTGLYWVWKNTSHEITGWMQEQRYLSLSGRPDKDSTVSGFSSQNTRENGWSVKKALPLLRRYGVIIPRAYHINDITAASQVISLLDFYQREGGSKEDMDVLLDIIKEKYPEYFIDALEVLHGDQFIPWHIFVLHREIFNNYADFLFSILFSLDEKHHFSSEKGFQRPVWGLISEIIYNIYFYNLNNMNKNIPFLNSAIVYIDSKDYNINRNETIYRVYDHEKQIMTAESKKVYFGGKVNIVLSFDNSYRYHAMAVINSILSHTSNKKDLHFYILHDEGLDYRTISGIRENYSDNVSLFSFLSVEKSFVHRFPMNRGHININTYYRLLIQNLLPKEIKRVLYLDTDIIVCDDIVDIWNTDMQSCSVAAVQDEMGLVGAYRLFCNGGEANSVFNAGVLLLDLEQAHKRYGNLDFHYARSFYDYAERILMQDQDILNLAYKNDVFILPLRWNVTLPVYCCRTSHSDARFDGAEHVYTCEERKQAAHNPAILHFTSNHKPWKMRCIHPLKGLYWHYRRQSDTGIWPRVRDCFICFNRFISLRAGVLSVHIAGREWVYHLYGRFERWRRIKD